MSGGADSDDTCWTCTHFYDPADRKDSLGQCRRHAPTGGCVPLAHHSYGHKLFVNASGNARWGDISERHYWTWMAATEWCGEHEVILDD